MPPLTTLLYLSERFIVYTAFTVVHPFVIVLLCTVTISLSVVTISSYARAACRYVRCRTFTSAEPFAYVASQPTPRVDHLNERQTIELSCEVLRKFTPSMMHFSSPVFVHKHTAHSRLRFLDRFVLKARPLIQGQQSATSVIRPFVYAHLPFVRSSLQACVDKVAEWLRSSRTFDRAPTGRVPSLADQMTERQKMELVLQNKLQVLPGCFSRGRLPVDGRSSLAADIASATKCISSDLFSGARRIYCFS